ncbi:unnamed protein product [Lepidochelys kempii]
MNLVGRCFLQDFQGPRSCRESSYRSPGRRPGVVPSHERAEPCARNNMILPVTFPCPCTNLVPAAPAGRSFLAPPLQAFGTWEWLAWSDIISDNAGRRACWAGFEDLKQWGRGWCCRGHGCSVLMWNMPSGSPGSSFSKDCKTRSSPTCCCGDQRGTVLLREARLGDGQCLQETFSFLLPSPGLWPEGEPRGNRRRLCWRSNSPAGLTQDLLGSGQSVPQGLGRS